MRSYYSLEFLTRRWTQNMSKLLLMSLVYIMNIRVNSSDSTTSCLIVNSSSSAANQNVTNSISGANLVCSPECNTVTCVFGYENDRVGFSLTLKESLSAPGDIRIEATPQGDKANVIFVPQHLLYFKGDQSKQPKTGQSEQSKAGESDPNVGKEENSSSEKKPSFPWNVLYSVHEDGGEMHLLVSVGRIEASLTNECLIFQYVSGYRRKLGHSTTGVYCSDHKNDRVPDRSVKKFNPKCGSVQLSLDSLKYDVAVLVDQRDACRNDSVYAMAYRLDSEKGGVITEASIYLLNFHMLRDGSATMRLQPQIDAPNRFFDPEDVLRSIVDLSLAEDGKNLIISWRTDFKEYTNRIIRRDFAFLSYMPLVECESHMVDALWDDESKDIDPEDTKKHAVCHSFNHALRSSSLRRQNMEAAQRKNLEHLSSDVTIQCIATECTKAMCTVEVEDKRPAQTQSSLNKNYVLVIEFEIPLCHMHAIFYKLYEMREKRRMYVTDGTIGVSSTRSSYDKKEQETYSITGAVYYHDFPVDNPGLLNNIYFDARYLCGPLLNESYVREEDREELYTEYLLQKRCFHRQSASYPLIMMATRTSICDVSTSISDDQCEDVKSSLAQTPASPGSGGFYFMVNSGKPQTHITYDCDVNENCDGINCLYTVYSLTQDPLSFHDGGTLGKRVISQTVVHYRNEHCSQFSKGLVTTGESLYHTNTKFLLGDESEDSNPQFDFRTAYRPINNEQVSLEGTGKLPTLFIPDLKTASSNVTLTLMDVEPSLTRTVFNSRKRNLLSINLKYGISLRYNQARDVNLGATECESEQFTISRTCKEWKDAAVKFQLPTKRFSCSSDLTCAGMNCKEHSSGESYHVQFGLCLGFRIFVTKQSSSPDAKGGGTEDKVSVYTNGSYISELGKAYVHDYVMYRDSVVLILKTSAISGHFTESVIPRSCPKVPGSREEKLQNSSTDLKKVLDDEEFQVKDVKDFVYTPQEDIHASPQKRVSISASSNWKPLLFGFALTTTFIILMTSLSIMLCKKRGYRLERPNSRLPRGLRFDFSRNMRHQTFTDSSAVLYRDDEDDVSLDHEGSLRRPQNREMVVLDSF